MTDSEINSITGDILDSSIKIHKLFGPGLLESVYERMLAVELRKLGHLVMCQQDVSFSFEGERFANAFRLDMIVDDEVVVELKSAGAMSPVFPKQLRTYLVILGKHVGVLVNFGMALLMDGYVRVINDVPSPCLCVSVGDKEQGGIDG